MIFLQMEWAIPIQTFDPKHVRLGTFHTSPKQIVPLSYQDGQLTFLSLCILLPTLNVRSYDAATGRLVLSLAGNSSTQAKLQQFQELLFSSVARLQGSWFPSEAEKDVREVRAGFQSFLDGSSLHLYCPILGAGGAGGSSAAPTDIQFYSNGTWTRGAPPSSATDIFSTGAPIRLVIRIQGLSFHQHSVTGVWTGRFRLQHRIVAVYAD
jgi:hypothetical protein